MGVATFIADTLQNVATSLGTSKDKATYNRYFFQRMTAQELEAAYRGSHLAKRIINRPADDMIREWRVWQTEQKHQTAIEKEEKRLKVQGHLKRGLRAKRLWGGSALYMGISGAGQPWTPLDPSRVKKGAFKFLTLFASHQLHAGDMDRDPESPSFGHPKEYIIHKPNGGEIRIHPSRLIILRGEEIPSVQAEFGTSEESDWGDSKLQSTLDTLKSMESAYFHTSSMMHEAKLDIIKIKHLAKNLQEGGETYEKNLAKRLSLGDQFKSSLNAIVMDKDNEDYEQKQLSFGSVPELLDRFMQMTASAAEMPVTLLFGRSPAGMNATGESDIRNYYDSIRSEQTVELEPQLAVFDECLVRSAIGSYPTDIYYDWRPLWQPSAKEKAETGSTLAKAMKDAKETASLPEEVVGEALVNALTESGAFPGLEESFSKWLKENPDGLETERDVAGSEDPDAEADEAALGAGNGRPAPASEGSGRADQLPQLRRADVDHRFGDARPRTLYISRSLKNADDVIRWAKDQGIPGIPPADELHVTVIHSTTLVDWMKVGSSWDADLIVPEGGPRLVEQFGQESGTKHIVLLFDAGELRFRHWMAKEAGASFDYDEYQPHVTIGRQDPANPIDLDKIKPYTGKLEFGPEIFKEVNEDWKNK